MQLIDQEDVRVAEARLLLKDGFEQEQRRGTVVGSRTADGTARLGVDVERVMSVDHGALRIEPLYRAGWGRAGIAYGPFKRESGLALGVFMLNGHNTSQIEVFPGTMTRRLARWAFGSLGSAESKRIIVKRMWRWLRSEHTRRFVRRVRWWFRLKALSGKLTQPTDMDENLAVGWFSEAAPGEAIPDGNAFVMHALGPENGELCAQVGKAPLPSVRGVQNVPIYYVVILRERGAAYYAASLPGAFGLAAHPHMRPLAIDASHMEDELYAGVHQCILGQIGFRVDTRVYSVAVVALPEWSRWYGTAHAADTLVGEAGLTGSVAEIGGAWRTIAGAFLRTRQGAATLETQNAALLWPDAPSGLIHALVELDPADAGEAGLIWRAASQKDYWLLKAGSGECSLCIVEGGTPHIFATGTHDAALNGEPLSLQVLDDGKQIAAYLNGALLFGRRFGDGRLAEATGVGLWSSAARAHVRQFEAHPRSVPIPPTLDQGAPWHRQGQQVIVSEAFEGEARPLERKPTTTGGQIWQRSLGSGHIDVLGNGSGRVRASAQAPNPGRTAFTVAWDDTTFADLQLDMTPPGTARGQGERDRCGVVFWQDADNYIIVCIYLEDGFPGASVSSFFHLGGFEELYDAVWTNTTRHVDWGVPFSLRVQFDGVRYLASLNDESMLFRALTDVYPSFERLAIKRMGLVVNWEWGDDTGTTLHHFVARV